MAEQIVNEFTVNRPIEEAWPIISDVERIAPCLPGAQLEEIEGDIYRGNVKVKLGAVVDEVQGRGPLRRARRRQPHARCSRRKGRDTGGRGNAEADIHATAEALSPTSTKCIVTADLHITGKVAQFGRGIMGDVSRKLIDQFAAQPQHDARRAGPESSEPPSRPRPATLPPSTLPRRSPRPARRRPPTQPTVRKIEGPAAEPIDLADMAGPALLKRLGPAVAAILLILLLLRRRR